MTEESRQELIDQFEYELKSTSREGIAELLEFIRKSDFYTAPASTIYHGNYKGGLLEHSLNVLDALRDKFHCRDIASEKSIWNIENMGYEDENLIIAALLHDLCKTYYYTIEMRNKKIDGKWESVPFYTVDDKIPYGHGEKSVMMAEEYIKLKPCERYAIRWHMGFSEPKESYRTLGEAMKKYPIILAIHEADLEATYITEKEGEK